MKSLLIELKELPSLEATNTYLLENYPFLFDQQINQFKYWHRLFRAVINYQEELDENKEKEIEVDITYQPDPDIDGKIAIKVKLNPEQINEIAIYINIWRNISNKLMEWTQSIKHIWSALESNKSSALSLQGEELVCIYQVLFSSHLTLLNFLLVNHVELDSLLQKMYIASSVNTTDEIGSFWTNAFEAFARLKLLGYPPLYGHETNLKSKFKFTIDDIDEKIENVIEQLNKAQMAKDKLQDELNAKEKETIAKLLSACAEFSKQEHGEEEKILIDDLTNSLTNEKQLLSVAAFREKILFIQGNLQNTSLFHLSLTEKNYRSWYYFLNSLLTIIDGPSYSDVVANASYVVASSTYNAVTNTLSYLNPVSFWSRGAATVTQPTTPKVSTVPAVTQAAESQPAPVIQPEKTETEASISVAPAPKSLSILEDIEKLPSLANIEKFILSNHPELCVEGEFQHWSTMFKEMSEFLKIQANNNNVNDGLEIIIQKVKLKFTSEQVQELSDYLKQWDVASENLLKLKKLIETIWYESFCEKLQHKPFEVVAYEEQTDKSVLAELIHWKLNAIFSNNKNYLEKTDELYKKILIAVPHNKHSNYLIWQSLLIAMDILKENNYAMLILPTYDSNKLINKILIAARKLLSLHALENQPKIKTETNTQTTYFDTVANTLGYLNIGSMFNRNGASTTPSPVTPSAQVESPQSDFRW